MINSHVAIKSRRILSPPHKTATTPAMAMTTAAKLPIWTCFASAAALPVAEAEPPVLDALLPLDSVPVSRLVALPVADVTIVLPLTTVV
jgi:hypothetical protein